ncbi:MAG TPA: four helix bundle protein [Solirubrobacterales bacterium]
MGARSFEDLIAWQKARALAAAISKTAKEPAFARDRILVDQIVRAVRSIGANIAEGFERNSRREFMHYLSIAKGSASEVRAHLYHAFDDGLISESTLTQLKSQTEEVGRILFGLRASLQAQRKRD